MKSILSVVLFALACLLILIAAGPAHAQLSVVDGDTLRIGGERIRLWGIDAPEMTTAAGKRSRAALQAIIGDRPVSCEAMDKDRYGRTVARCYIGNLDLACEMVRQGHAQDWPRYSNGYYRRCRVRRRP